MTSNIAPLIAKLSSAQGRVILMNMLIRHHCSSPSECYRIRKGTDWSVCWGDREEIYSARVIVNFCELRKDRIVIHYTPLQGRKKQKQRQFHVMSSALERIHMEEDWLSVRLNYSGVVELELIGPQKDL